MKKLLAGLALAAMGLAMPAAARAEDVVVPNVPDSIKVPEGNRAFLVGHAIGTQNYICLPSGGGFAWSLFTPEATLSNQAGHQLITHFFSPDPLGTVRATWMSSRDTSTVWAAADAPPLTIAPFVAPGAVAWLRLKVVNHTDGIPGGQMLSNTTYIQRLNTAGGVAPLDGCAVAGDVGRKAFEPYTADYFFYTDAPIVPANQ